MTRVVGYVRVSTPDQNPALQVDALRAAGATELFEDRASGAKLDRKGLKTALASLSEGDTLIVWKIDRLGRSLRQLIETLDELRERGVHFRSLSDGIDTTTNAGRMMFAMVAAFAEFERSVIRERVTAGIAAARRAGKAHGRPAKLGPDSADLAREMLSQGHSWQATARALRVGKTTLHRALHAYPEIRHDRTVTPSLDAGEADAEAAPVVIVRVRRDRGPEGKA